MNDATPMRLAGRARRNLRAAGLAGLCVLALASPAMPLDTLGFRLQGVDDDALEEQLRTASLLAQLEAEGNTAPRDLLAAAQADYTRLVETLYARGFYSASVQIKIDGQEAALIPPLAAPEQISKIRVVVEPGRPFRFGETRIAPLAPGAQPDPAIARDEPALATTVRDAAQGALKDWRAAGYAKASIAGQSIQARHGGARLDVDVTIDPGPRLRFGKVIVDGESTVKEGRVRQIAGIPRGDVFDPDVVDTAAGRLRSTGTFQSVDLVEADEVSPDGTMDILIDVVDRKPRRFGAGVELSSFEGLTLSGFWLHRNFFGGAERLRLSGEVRQIGGQSGGTDYNLSARFEKPAVYGPETLFFAHAGLDYLDEPDFISERFEIGLGVSREFSKELSGEVALEYSFSKVTDLFLPKVNGKHPTRELSVLSLPISLTLDKRDTPLDATEGYYLRGDVTPFALLGESQGGAQVKFDARAYRNLSREGSVVLAGRFQLGALFGPDAVDAPPDYLFYSGGGGTVRGQPYQSLDADYSGTRLGGRSFVGLSGELRVAVNDTIGVVAFADAGYIGPESTFDGSGDWHSGAGLGLRYDTTLGPIRVDLAAPVSGDTSDGMQLYIGIGQAF